MCQIVCAENMYIYTSVISAVAGVQMDSRDKESLVS